MLLQELIHRLEKLDSVILVAQEVIAVLELEIGHVLAILLELRSQFAAVLQLDPAVFGAMSKQDGNLQIVREMQW